MADITCLLGHRFLLLSGGSYRIIHSPNADITTVIPTLNSQKEVPSVAAVIEVFDKWKAFLGERVEQAEKAGMSEDMISKLAFQIGEFLSDKVDPENKEERVLKELWDAADQEERKVMAKIMVKLVKKSA
jgi:hypothetical protein